MRLSEQQCSVIRTAVAENFGVDANVWLFGSRLDDTARGGDIDLYIEADTDDADAIVNAKLQDAMGAKLFPAVLELTKEQGNYQAFLDKLNRLEKIGAIESADQWLILREMRNEFAHDYPDDPAIQVAILNKAYPLASELLAILNKIEIFASHYRPAIDK